MRRTLAVSILLVPLLLAAERPPAALPSTAAPASAGTDPEREREIDRIVDGVRQKFARATEHGTIVRRDGTRAVALGEDRVHFATARIDADGKPRIDCAKGARAAVRAVLEPPAAPAEE